MCCAEFIVKYVLIIVNVIFSILGLAIAALGIVLIVQLSDILELIPENVNSVPITIIVVGCFIFVISYLACCGAIKESRCMLITYSIFMLVLAAGKVYLAVVTFDFLSSVQTTVTGWLSSSFTNQNLRPAFNVMESLFQCCGTTGPGSYGANPLPVTCCAEPVGSQCLAQDSFGGCNDRLVSYFETFSEAVGAVLIVIIAVELVATIFALFLSWRIKGKTTKQFA